MSKVDEILKGTVYQGATEGPWAVDLRNPIGMPKVVATEHPQQVICTATNSPANARVIANAKLNAARAIVGRQLRECLEDALTMPEDDRWHTKARAVMIAWRELEADHGA